MKLVPIPVGGEFAYSLNVIGVHMKVKVTLRFENSNNEVTYGNSLKINKSFIQTYRVKTT